VFSLFFSPGHSLDNLDFDFEKDAYKRNLSANPGSPARSFSSSEFSPSSAGKKTQCAYIYVCVCVVLFSCI
jgi:hypothetical protein